MITDQLVIVRGGGDLATGTIWALRRAGFPVLILESDHPSAIRRTVALSEAVYEGSATVEDLTVQLAENLDQAQYSLFENGIAMLVDPEGHAIREGSAIPNTGTPGLIAGHAQDRVLHSPAAGILHALAQIGDQVEQDQVIAQIEQSDGSCVPVKATFTGLLRGLIRDGFVVKEGFKIADIDPRREEYENCFTISDKARALGSAVVMELVGYAARKAVDE